MEKSLILRLKYLEIGIGCGQIFISKKKHFGKVRVYSETILLLFKSIIKKYVFYFLVKKIFNR